jgi:selenocysteine lyase/cysteine desulfurase
MYITDEMIDLLDLTYAAKFSFTSIDRAVEKLELAPDAHRYEYGNPNFLGLWVQKRSAEFIHSIGLEHIEARVRSLTTYLIEELEARQFKVLTPRPWEERAGLISAAIDGNADEIESSLRERGIIAAAKDGNIRAGVHFYNNADDIDCFVEGLSSIARGH